MAENAEKETGQKDMSKRFEPKTPVKLDPPKDDPITEDYLSKCDGQHAGYPTYVAIRGTVFDVTGRQAYGPEGGYRMLAGHDASRALAKVSLKEEDVRPEWEDLSDKEKNTLEEWYVFFSKRYNVVGKVVPGSRRKSKTRFEDFRWTILVVIVAIILVIYAKPTALANIDVEW